MKKLLIAFASAAIGLQAAHAADTAQIAPATTVKPLSAEQVKLQQKAQTAKETSAKMDKTQRNVLEKHSKGTVVKDEASAQQQAQHNLEANKARQAVHDAEVKKHQEEAKQRHAEHEAMKEDRKALKNQEKAARKQAHQEKKAAKHEIKQAGKTEKEKVKALHPETVNTEKVKADQPEAVETEKGKVKAVQPEAEKIQKTIKSLHN